MIDKMLHTLLSEVQKISRAQTVVGEAIAAGMICETYLSEKYCNLPRSSAKSIEDYIQKTFGRILISNKEIEDITLLCLQDKKNEKGVINFSLLKEIGISLFNVGVEQNDIRNVLQLYAQL